MDCVNTYASTRIFMRSFFQLCCLITLLTCCDFGVCVNMTGSSSSSENENEIECIPSEREALVSLKHHLKDPSNRLSSWNASNPNCCHWDGVVCSHLTPHVLQLHLNATSPPNFDDYYSIGEYEEAYDAYRRSWFGGEINHSLVELKHLNYLDLSGNYFGGMQIPTFLCEITTLTYLNLSDAGFDGKIPHQIGNLSNLLYLDLAFAANGTIPHQIGNLTKLLHLDLRSFYDTLVAERIIWLLGLSGLQYLDLRQVNLSKSFDWLQTMQALPLLVELHMVGCTLGGYNQPSTLNFSSLLSFSISVAPKWIFGLSKLVSLQFGPNYYSSSISGPIPDGIQNLTMLENLDLSHNFFSSSIPNWLYGLHHLKFLTLCWNNLNGTISDAVRNLASLVSLDLSDNQLEGVIPSSLGNLKSLVNLDLSYNQFEGVIPSSLENLASLVSLDLSANRLEGAIPAFLGNLTSLSRLYLSYSQLKGKIPNSLRNLCNLKEISVSGLKCNQQIYEILEILSPCISSRLKSFEAYSSQISGSFTDQIGMFNNLVTLDFSDNLISGELPLSFGKLASLRGLQLSQNRLTGNPFKTLQSIPKLSSLFIDDNIFQGVVQEDDLANFTNLKELSASSNNLTLKVDPNWQPSFQLAGLDLSSWQVGPSFPSWIRSQKDLRYLVMSNIGISNSIPKWFWKAFPYAYYLDFSHNQIHDKLPNTLESLKQIEMVDLSSNHLYGKIPYLPVGLEWLDLSNNSFSGSMANFLCQKHDKPKLLQFLNLALNNLSGDIPDCWKMLPYLGDLNLQSNYFIGSLPLSMGSLTELQSLHINNNTLSGGFPLIFKNTSNLISLDLGENNFSGVIPAWVGERLINLKILRLRSNKFSGNIPDEICDMKFLQDLDLAQNRLLGKIPKCFNHWSSMVINRSNIEDSIISEENITYSGIISMLIWLNGIGIEYCNILGLVKNIDLSCNKLSGEIPREITDLSGLIFLNLSKNELSGHIPQSIGNMRSLESIDFSRNQLSGEIPSTITNLSFLRKLDLSYNHLKGKIPTGTQLQSFEASNFIGNDLCGPPLLVNCSFDGKAPGADHNDRGNNKHEVNWLFVSMGFGFIVGFWGVVAPLFIYRSWRYAYFRFLDDIWYKLQSRW